MGRTQGAKTKRQRYSLSFRNHDDSITELGTFTTMQEIATRLGCCSQAIWNFVEGRISHGGRKLGRYKVTRIQKETIPTKTLDDLIEEL